MEKDFLIPQKFLNPYDPNIINLLNLKKDRLRLLKKMKPNVRIHSYVELIFFGTLIEPYPQKETLVLLKVSISLD